MNWVTRLTLAGFAVMWAYPAQTGGSEPAAEAPGTAAPTATITLEDGSAFRATLLGAEGGVLEVVEDGRKRAIPLEKVDRLVFRWRQHSGAADSPDAPDGEVRESDSESHTLGQLVWAFGSVTGESFSGKTHADSARMALGWWYEER